MKLISRHITFILLGLSLLFGSPGLAAAVWQPVSPAPATTVSSGQILMVVAYDSTISLQKNSVEIFLDDYLLSNNIKIFKNQISMLYLLPLKPGEHKFEIRANAAHIGWLRPLIWNFNVRSPGPDQAAPNQGPNVNEPKTHWASLTGQVGIEYRKYGLSGEQQGLRQELPMTRNLYVNTRLKLGKLTIPVRYYNTSDEQNYVPSLQSRNYFQVGAQTKWLDARYGDLNPALDRLIFSGIRLHGEQVSIKLKRINLTVVDGYMQRAVNGTLSQYIPGSGVPPSNIKNDNTYVIPGTFKRRVSAIRLALGNREEGASTAINIMKARDDMFSIQYGEMPNDNLVLGIDQSVVTNEAKMRINAGLALSFFTRDASGGAISKSAVDSIFGFTLPFDPLKWDNVLVINETTRKYSKQSLAGYFNTVFHSKRNDLMLEYRYTGGGYVSLANPYLMSDLRGGIIQDQFSLWKRRIVLTGRYNIQLSNLSESQYNFFNTHIGNGNIMIAPNPKLPRVNLFYVMQWRISPPSESLLASANDRLDALGGNISYTLNAFGASHSVMLNVYQSQRVDKVWIGNDLGLRTASINIYEQLPLINLTIDASIGKALVQDKNSPAYHSLYTLYSARVKYTFDKLKSEIGLGYGSNIYDASIISLASRRDVYRFTYTGRFVKDLLLDVEAGFAPYQDLSVPLGYQENFVILRASYNLNFR